MIMQDNQRSAPPVEDMQAGQINLSGRVAMITGGGRGIGRAYTERFLREGASVVVADVDEDNADDGADDLVLLVNRRAAGVA